jgi:hypothetical protein
MKKSETKNKWKISKTSDTLVPEAPKTVTKAELPEASAKCQHRQQ